MRYFFIINSESPVAGEAVRMGDNKPVCPLGPNVFLHVSLFLHSSPFHPFLEDATSEQKICIACITPPLASRLLS